MATSMGESDITEEPQLSKIFEDARANQAKLDDSSEPSNSKEFQDRVKHSISQLEKATHMVNELSLFSRNEELEECPTAHLRYLLLPALLGDLTLRLMGEDRLSLVDMGRTYFVDYLRRCRDYGVTKEEIPEEPSPDAAPPPRPPMGGGRPNIAAMQANREAKIRRFKEAKETKQQLTALGSWESIASRDEDVQREFYVLVLRQWVHTALEQLSSIHQEKEILQHMASVKRAGAGPRGGPGGGPGGEGQGEVPPPEPPRKPLKPFILTKDTLQAQVFGAGYPSIPTMTLGEFYQKEIREGKIQLDSKNPSPQSEREAVEAKEIRKEQEVETDDPEALRKAREWDDWKDDHKRGWGNRENRS